jgi:hypothetical protein
MSTDNPVLGLPDADARKRRFWLFYHTSIVDAVLPAQCAENRFHASLGIGFPKNLGWSLGVIGVHPGYVFPVTQLDSMPHYITILLVK